METIETKLNRVDTAVTTIKTNLHFDTNAVIEDVATYTDLKRLTNVFIQEEEPVIQDGIWIQCDKATNHYDEIIVDREIRAPHKWLLQEKSGQLRSKYWSNSPRAAALPNTSPRSFGFANGFFMTPYYGAYYCDIRNGNTLGYDPGYSRKFYGRDCCVVTDTDVFYGPYTSNYSTSRYNIGTHTNGGGSPSWYYVMSMTYCPYNRCIYGLHGSSVITMGGVNLSAWNVDTGANTSIITAKNSADLVEKYSMLVPLGNRLLVIGYKPEDSFLLDLDTNKPATDEPAIVKTISLDDPNSEYALLDLPDCFYLYKGIEHVIKYNKETLESEDVTHLFADDNVENCYFMFYYEERIYMVTGPSRSEIYIMPMEMIGKQYNCDCVLISQAPITKTEHQTAFWTYEGLRGRLTQSFYDIYYYNKDSGYKLDYPIYYGNGTEWIKFK